MADVLAHFLQVGKYWIFYKQLPGCYFAIIETHGHKYLQGLLKKYTTPPFSSSPFWSADNFIVLVPNNRGNRGFLFLEKRAKFIGTFLCREMILSWSQKQTIITLHNFLHTATSWSNRHPSVGPFSHFYLVLKVFWVMSNLHSTHGVPFLELITDASLVGILWYRLLMSIIGRGLEISAKIRNWGL